MAGSADNAARFFMKRSSVLVSAAVVAVLTIGVVAYFPGEREARAPDAADTPRPAAHDAASSDRVPVDATQSSSPERAQQLALEIERALVARDSQQRETALNVLLPELIRAESARVVDMVARQQPGETRDLLRDEVARQWITLNRDAALEWIGSLEEAERRGSATIAMRTLAASDPAQAIDVADRFGVGRDDGSLEHIVQIWATENPDAAMRWIDSQPPDDPRTVQLRARIEQVRAQQRGVSR
jgi:hypothetical protein